VNGPLLDEVFAQVVPVDPPPSLNSLIREKVLRAMDYSMVLQEKEFLFLAPPVRPGGAYAKDKRVPDRPRAMPLASRFSEFLAQQWRLLVTGVPLDASHFVPAILKDPLTPVDSFAKAMPSFRSSLNIRELKWPVDAFPCEGKLPATISVPKAEFIALSSRIRELANISSNLEYPLSMLEALAAEEQHTLAPPRPEGDWPVFINPYVQAAKESLESLLKSSADALLHTTLLGRDALISTIKVGLVRGQTFFRV
jgi:hypothetical protein